MSNIHNGNYPRFLPLGEAEYEEDDYYKRLKQRRELLLEESKFSVYETLVSAASILIGLALLPFAPFLAFAIFAVVGIFFSNKSKATQISKIDRELSTRRQQLNRKHEAKHQDKIEAVRAENTRNNNQPPAPQLEQLPISRPTPQPKPLNYTEPPRPERPLPARSNRRAAPVPGGPVLPSAPPLPLPTPTPPLSPFLGGGAGGGNPPHVSGVRSISGSGVPAPSPSSSPSPLPSPSSSRRGLPMPGGAGGGYYRSRDYVSPPDDTAVAGVAARAAHIAALSSSSAGGSAQLTATHSVTVPPIVTSASTSTPVSAAPASSSTLSPSSSHPSIVSLPVPKVKKDKDDVITPATEPLPTKKVITASDIHNDDPDPITKFFTTNNIISGGNPRDTDAINNLRFVLSQDEVKPLLSSNPAAVLKVLRNQKILSKGLFSSKLTINSDKSLYTSDSKTKLVEAITTGVGSKDVDEVVSGDSELLSANPKITIEKSPEEIIREFRASIDQINSTYAEQIIILNKMTKYIIDKNNNNEEFTTEDILIYNILEGNQESGNLLSQLNSIAESIERLKAVLSDDFEILNIDNITNEISLNQKLLKIIEIDLVNCIDAYTSKFLTSRNIINNSASKTNKEKDKLIKALGTISDRKVFAPATEEQKDILLEKLLQNNVIVRSKDKKSSLTYEIYIDENGSNNIPESMDTWFSYKHKESDYKSAAKEATPDNIAATARRKGLTVLKVPVKQENFIDLTPKELKISNFCITRKIAFDPNDQASKDLIFLLKQLPVNQLHLINPIRKDEDGSTPEDILLNKLIEEGVIVANKKAKKGKNNSETVYSINSLSEAELARNAGIFKEIGRKLAESADAAGAAAAEDGVATAMAANPLFAGLSESATVAMKVESESALSSVGTEDAVIESSDSDDEGNSLLSHNYNNNNKSSFGTSVVNGFKSVGRFLGLKVSASAGPVSEEQELTLGSDNLKKYDTGDMGATELASTEPVVGGVSTGFKTYDDSGDMVGNTVIRISVKPLNDKDPLDNSVDEFEDDIDDVDGHSGNEDKLLVDPALGNNNELEAQFKRQQKRFEANNPRTKQFDEAELNAFTERSSNPSLLSHPLPIVTSVDDLTTIADHTAADNNTAPSTKPSLPLKDYKAAPTEDTTKIITDNNAAQAMGLVQGNQGLVPVAPSAPSHISAPRVLTGDSISNPTTGELNVVGRNSLKWYKSAMMSAKPLQDLPHDTSVTSTVNQNKPIYNSRTSSASSHTISDSTLVIGLRVSDAIVDPFTLGGAVPATDQNSLLMPTSTSASIVEPPKVEPTTSHYTDIATSVSADDNTGRPVVYRATPASLAAVVYESTGRNLDDQFAQSAKKQLLEQEAALITKFNETLQSLGYKDIEAYTEARRVNCRKFLLEGYRNGTIVNGGEIASELSTLILKFDKDKTNILDLAILEQRYKSLEEKLPELNNKQNQVVSNNQGVALPAMVAYDVRVADLLKEAGHTGDLDKRTDEVKAYKGKKITEIKELLAKANLSSQEPNNSPVAQASSSRAQASGYAKRSRKFDLSSGIDSAESTIISNNIRYSSKLQEEQIQIIAQLKNILAEYKKDNLSEKDIVGLDSHVKLLEKKVNSFTKELKKPIEKKLEKSIIKQKEKKISSFYNAKNIEFSSSSKKKYPNTLREILLDVDDIFLTPAPNGKANELFNLLKEKGILSLKKKKEVSSNFQAAKEASEAGVSIVASGTKYIVSLNSEAIVSLRKAIAELNESYKKEEIDKIIEHMHSQPAAAADHEQNRKSLEPSTQIGFGDYGLIPEETAEEEEQRGKNDRGQAAITSVSAGSNPLARKASYNAGEDLYAKVDMEALKRIFTAREISNNLEEELANIQGSSKEELEKKLEILEKYKRILEKNSKKIDARIKDSNVQENSKYSNDEYNPKMFAPINEHIDRLIELFNNELKTAESEVAPPLPPRAGTEQTLTQKINRVKAKLKMQENKLNILINYLKYRQEQDIPESENDIAIYNLLIGDEKSGNIRSQLDAVKTSIDRIESATNEEAGKYNSQDQEKIEENIKILDSIFEVLKRCNELKEPELVPVSSSEQEQQQQITEMLEGFIPGVIEAAFADIEAEDALAAAQARAANYPQSNARKKKALESLKKAANSAQKEITKIIEDLKTEKEKLDSLNQYISIKLKDPLSADNLEIVQILQGDDEKGSLLAQIDKLIDIAEAHKEGLDNIVNYIYGYVFTDIEFHQGQFPQIINKLGVISDSVAKCESKKDVNVAVPAVRPGGTRSLDTIQRIAEQKRQIAIAKQLEEIIKKYNCKNISEYTEKRIAELEKFQRNTSLVNDANLLNKISLAITVYKKPLNTVQMLGMEDQFASISNSVRELQNQTDKTRKQKQYILVSLGNEFSQILKRANIDAGQYQDSRIRALNDLQNKLKMESQIGELHDGKQKALLNEEPHLGRKNELLERIGSISSIYKEFKNSTSSKDLKSLLEVEKQYSAIARDTKHLLVETKYMVSEGEERGTISKDSKWILKFLEVTNNEKNEQIINQAISKYIENFQYLDLAKDENGEEKDKILKLAIIQDIVREIEKTENYQDELEEVLMGINIAKIIKKYAPNIVLKEQKDSPERLALNAELGDLAHQLLEMADEDDANESTLLAVKRPPNETSYDDMFEEFKNLAKESGIEINSTNNYFPQKFGVVASLDARRIPYPEPSSAKIVAKTNPRRTEIDVDKAFAQKRDNIIAQTGKITTVMDGRDSPELEELDQEPTDRPRSKGSKPGELNDPKAQSASNRESSFDI